MYYNPNTQLTANAKFHAIALLTYQMQAQVEINNVLSGVA